VTGDAERDRADRREAEKSWCVIHADVPAGARDAWHASIIMCTIAPRMLFGEPWSQTLEPRGIEHNDGPIDAGWQAADPGCAQRVTSFADPHSDGEVRGE